MGTLFTRLADALLATALAFECKRAGLTSASAQLLFGHIEYLHRTGHTAPAQEAIVMLHGAAADKTVWIRLSRYLVNRFQLVIPDLPGHGNSTTDIGLTYSIEQQAGRLEEFLGALGIEQVHLVGNSMGASIAIKLATSSKIRVSSLVLISAAGINSGPSWLRRRVESTGINPMIEVRDPSGYRNMMRIGMEAPPYLPGIMLSALARAFGNRADINRKIAKDIEQDLDQTRLLSTISAPSLIIWGEADRVAHVDDAEFLRQRLANSRKIVMKGIGHVPMVEAPKQIAAACSAFYAERMQDD